jgi:hypothetical protein
MSNPLHSLLWWTALFLSLTVIIVFITGCAVPLR